MDRLCKEGRRRRASRGADGTPGREERARLAVEARGLLRALWAVGSPTPSWARAILSHELGTAAK